MKICGGPGVQGLFDFVFFSDPFDPSQLFWETNMFLSNEIYKKEE